MTNGTVLTANGRAVTLMADLDKVLKGFEHCMMESDGIQDNPCADCPYLSKPGCSTTLKQDAVELLKSQQAKIKKYELDKSWEDSPDRMNGCGW